MAHKIIQFSNITPKYYIFFILHMFYTKIYNIVLQTLQYYYSPQDEISGDVRSIA